MDFRKHLEISWNLLLNNLGDLIILTLVMSLICFTIVLAPVAMAGYWQSILRLIRENRQPKIQDLFEYMNLFIPLLIFSVALFIVSLLGFALLYLPGIAVVCFVTFACLYMIPLMTDRKMGITDAIKSSWQLAIRDNIADHLVIVILYIGLMAIGCSVFIGTLFTQPFATLFVLSIYLERTGNNPADEV